MFHRPPSNEIARRLLPYSLDVTHVPFAGCSEYPTNIGRKNHAKQRHIIVGGFNEDIEFYELIVGSDSKSIHFKSFTRDYFKKSATLQLIGLKNAVHTHSYLIQNNKYIVVFYSNQCYNVYDMNKDLWLLGEKSLPKNGPCSRSVLINDEIIIISNFSHVYFYYIGNDGDSIKDPLLIHEHKLKLKLGIEFQNHGMCIIYFIKQKSLKKDELYQNYGLRIALFGGERASILSSFVFLDVMLSYANTSQTDCNSISLKLFKVSITEHLIDRNKIKYKLSNKIGNIRWCKWSNFGFKCVLNCIKQPIIVMFGGDGYRGMNKSIHLFNCDSLELTSHTRVL